MTTAFTTIWDEGRKMDVRCDNLPEYVDDNAISMTANARTVLEKRYLRKGSDGKPIETIAGMFYRIASVVAQAEKPEEREDWTHRFYDLMSSFDFLPNTPTFTGAGTPLGQLAACFVLPVEDDMGRSPDGIFSTLRNAALIQQTGGGVGFSFSRLRPKGGRVSRSNGQATGPVDFMRVYDKAFGVIAQGGSRRGANMGVLRVDHPDIREFIIAKATEGDVANFNISVGITDVFMDAVKDDKEYAIIDPHTGATVRYEKAREIFDLIADCAHRNGEPGLLFLDRANRANPVPNLYTLEATNPCVTGDTLIRTKEGKFRADELYETGRPLMVEVSPVFGVDRWQHVSHVFCTGEKMVYSLETVAGHYLKATADHKIMTARGWVEMSQLESNDLVQVVNNEWESSFVGIERIEEIGIEKVYDLTEPVTHSFIANGIVVHNCGEQWLGPYENCCLGSINLANHVHVKDGVNSVDWLKLMLTARTATRFLDNVVTVNRYVPDVPQLKQAAQATRRIGLGIMGLADALYMLNLPYDSDNGVSMASQMMEHIHFFAMSSSVNLSSERGSFEAIKGSIFDPDDFRWNIPKFWSDNESNPGSARWLNLVSDIKKYGIRNSTVTTIAPTGTISTVAGLEGYGCEPVFALGYIRHFKDGDKDVELSYVSPIFQKAIQDADITNEKRKYLIDYAAHHGTLRGANINGVPENIVKTFVTSGDIDHLSHIEMQSALQRFVSNSISKTINMPEDSTVDDVAKAYQVAYIYGCNGITVYRTGSRNQVVLETASTKNKKQDTEQTLIPTKRQRPAQMRGSTIRKETPTGRAYVTVNEDNGQPFEVFVNVGKAGSEITAVSEAIGRLISMILRMPAQMAQLERLKWVAEELGGIGGSRPFGFGAKRVLSLADGIAQALREYIGGEPVSEEMAATPIEKSKPVGDICPDCGEATLLHVEGCNKCANCGYSAC